MRSLAIEERIHTLYSFAKYSGKHLGQKLLRERDPFGINAVTQARPGMSGNIDTVCLQGFFSFSHIVERYHGINVTMDQQHRRSGFDLVG